MTDQPLTDDQATALLHRAIGHVAPDVDPADVEPDEDLWFALDLDSMDQLNVMIAIRDQSGIDIPEADYPLLTTVADAVSYLTSVSAGGTA